MDGYFFTNWFNTNLTTTKVRSIVQHVLNTLVGLVAVLIFGQCCYQLKYSMFGSIILAIFAFMFGWLYLLFYFLFNRRACILQDMFPFRYVMNSSGNTVTNT